jgi:hypothetical protein
LAFIHLLADPPLWRGDLSNDDEPRLLCECKFQVDRPDGSITFSAPTLELADTLRLCFERALNSRTTATEFLWDSGERVSVSIQGQACLTVELPVGTEPIIIEQAEFLGFITDCYVSGISAFRHFPAVSSNGS